MKLILLALLTALSSYAKSATTSTVETRIVKSSNNAWLVIYTVKEPVKRLGFVSNPDSARTERWIPTDAEFEVVVDNKKEYVQQKDGSTFSQVSISLTPTYTHLTKDYAPFSPFSDGGNLIYTGRLFACVNECGGATNVWKMTIEVPDSEHIIVNGKVITPTYSWLDSDDGMNVYVGTQTPVETANVIAVIDDGLPAAVKRSLDTNIPRLMDFFEHKLGKISGTKPTLFASYANIDGHSSQGGTLPKQIFMHWNLNNLEKSSLEHDFTNKTFWFFAHEVAHFYQEDDKTPLYGEGEESWLHEGHADWLAFKALAELSPKTQQFLDAKVTSFTQTCAEGLAAVSLSEAADNGRFDLYYSCGLLIHKAIDEALAGEPDKDIYALWNEYRNRVKKGEKKGAETFLTVTKEWTSSTLVNNIERMIHTHLDNPQKTLSNL